ncbi:MAG: family 43 glycosylhydrolase, partial [Eubacterium sp.]|nr:family 43 glycosylhydrolase [Eubacterium sp.]
MRRNRKALACLLALAVAVGTLISPEEAAAAKKVKLNKKKLTLRVGKKYKLKLKNNKKKVKWSSSKKKVATVTKKGLVKAKKKGTCKITAKVGKKKYVCKVTVKKKKTTKTTTTTTATATPKVTSAPAANPTATPNVPLTNFTLDHADVPSTIQLSSTNDYNTYWMYSTVEPSNATEKIKFTFSDDSVAKVMKDGNDYALIATGAGETTVTASIANGKKETFTLKVNMPTDYQIKGHDPSVYRDPTDNRYYSFSSHVVSGYSDNLVSWTNTANGYNDSTNWFKNGYTKEFAEPYNFTGPDKTADNFWAPDIIYNPKAKKYYMYVSVVDGSTRCCIAMASSDYPDHDYEYQGMICCSGISTSDSSDILKTNVADALGMTEEEVVASKYAKLGKNSPDCIDSTVLYDHNGNLWMVYGSFTTAGGIRLLKLDPNTGLRGENYEDSGEGTATTLSEADPYYGLRIENNNGEGPYIQEVKSSKSSTGYYYYLWTSTGNLQSYGGYNMRMVRSENIEGPYVDPKGNEATGTAGKAELGLRVMDNYKFSFMDYAFTSCGGNSATDDGNGKTFIHFHQKFA